MTEKDRNHSASGVAGKSLKTVFAFWTIVLAASLATALFLQLAAQHFPGFADAYTHNIYPHIVSVLGGFWGKVPFSAVEILLYIFLLFWLLFLTISVIRVIQKRHCAFRKILLRILAMAATCSMLYFVYIANCGVNYYARPFSAEAGFTRGGYDAESLGQVCVALTQELIELSGQVERDENGCLKETPDWKQEAQNAMTALGRKYPQLAIDYPQPKPVLVSRILSVQGVTGVYSPFTVEANYNAEMTTYNIPFTMCHELSHLCGFMREDEANFIGWLACRQSQDVTFRYSSAMLGWINCTNELAQMDPKAHQELAAMLPEEVWEELRVNNAFWEKYEGKASEVHERVNDAYLKANGQEEGVRSYERMVELIVSYYQKSGDL